MGACMITICAWDPMACKNLGFNGSFGRSLGGHANCNYACGPGIASGVALLYLMLNPHLHPTFFYDQFLHQSLINLDDISYQFWMPSLEKYFFLINRNMLMQVYLIQTPSRVAFVCQFHKLRCLLKIEIC